MRVDRHEKGVRILQTLEDAGYEAYFVGGYVRDYLLGINTKDIDITTAARPEIVEELFARVKPTGRAFGTMTVLIEDVPFEVTTFRRDGTYDNHRHPDEIAYSDSLAADLARRDFTINQLVMDARGNILDHHGGREDLSKDLVRTIGEADARFSEDALRMLRAFRFMAVLGFQLETETEAAIRRQGHLIRKVSIERVQEELFKLFRALYARHALQALAATDFHRHLSIAEGVERLAASDVPFGLHAGFALLDECDGLDREHWRFSKRFSRTLHRIRDAASALRKEGPTPRIVFEYGHWVCRRANTLNRLLGHADAADEIEAVDRELPLRSLKELAFKGEDARRLPVAKPHHIRIVLDELLGKVLDGELPNEYEQLKKEAEKLVETLKEDRRNA